MQHSEDDAPITDDIIAPKSDQLNADDLIGGPKLIVITRVSAGNSEQPRHIHYVGGEGRPWKPCKTMMRVLKEHWGTNGYRGRSVLLVRDPTVSYGKNRNCGGIRIAGLSDIPADTQSMVSINRETRRALPIKRLDSAPATEPKAAKPPGNIEQALRMIAGTDKTTIEPVLTKLREFAWTKEENRAIKEAADKVTAKTVAIEVEDVP